MVRAWPVAGALLYAGAVALVHLLEYNRLISAHSWTAATITIALGLLLSLIAGVIGWFLGGAVRELASPGGDKRRAAIMAASIVLFTGYMTVSIQRNRAREIRLRAIREEALTPARENELMATGTPSEIQALSWNRSLSAERLRELAKSPDYVIRANVAAHPTTPDEVAAKLALDPHESVRIYASHHPSRRK